MVLRIALCLLLASVATSSSADLLGSAAGSVDEAVLAFFQEASRAGPLADRLGLRQDAEIARMGDDLELELARRIRETLNRLLERIEDHVNNGKAVATELIEKVKELKKLKEGGGEGEKLKEIREKAKEVLKGILEKLGHGKRNLDDSMDHVARLRFRDLEERIREELVSEESIRKLREYIQNFEGESPVVAELSRAVRAAGDDELRQVALAALQGGEGWDRLQEYGRKFKGWMRDVWGRGMDRLRDKYANIKAIAMEFVANSKDLSSELAREALDFLHSYKDDLGTLWEQIDEATKEAIGKF